MMFLDRRARTDRHGRRPAGRTRRQLLTGAATGAAGAIAAQTLLAAGPAYAGTDGDVVLGQLNSTPNGTGVTCTSDGLTALQGNATGGGTALQGSSDTGIGVNGLGAPGVLGGTTAPGSNGVEGDAGFTENANGVYGHANNTFASGVYGQNDGSGFGVAGRAGQGTGVMGDSQAGIGVSARTATGTALEVIADSAGGQGIVTGDGGTGDGPAVLAELTNPDNPSPAIRADTIGTGPAIVGTSFTPGAQGVRGQGEDGATGVSGTSDSGTGVHAESKTGVALHVAGRVTFSRSGLATIQAGSKTVTVRMAGVSSTSLILATPHKVVGQAAVAGAVPGTGSFTIHLTQAPVTNLQVAYLVLG